MSQDQNWLSIKADNHWFAWFNTAQNSSDVVIDQPALNQQLILSEQQTKLSIYYTKHAPEFAVTTNLAVIFDGELHNKKELNAQYRLTDGQYSAQVIAQLYHQLGTNLIEKIKGIYCLIIWDKNTRLLLVVRDRLGIYPLFYSRKNSEFFISTSIDSLIHYTGIDKQLDRMQLAEHLLNRWVEPERTYYQEIKRLLPGNVLEIKANNLTIYRYWQRSDQPLKWAGAAELAEFDQLLQQAVTRAIGGRKAGIFLSSGIDSVTVAVIAAQLAAQTASEISSLSLYFPDPKKDDSAIQNQVADRLGFKHSLFTIDESLGKNDPLDQFLKMSVNWPVPPIVFWSPAFYYLGLQGVAQGCEVILTGEGGDEWIGVGPFLAADLLKSLDFTGLYNFWRYLNRSHTLTKLAALNLTLWKFSLRPVLGNTFRNTLLRISPDSFKQRARRLIIRSLPEWFAPDAQLKAELIEQSHQFAERQLQSLSQAGSFYAYNGQIYFEHPVASMAHEQTFEMSNRIGAKILAPFLDSDLIDLLIAAPPEFLIRNGYGKAPTRKILADTFPDLNFDKQKKYFLDPLVDNLLMKRFPEFYQNDRLPDRLIELDIIDKKRFNAYKESNLENSNVLFYFREILNLETWLSSR